MKTTRDFSFNPQYMADESGVPHWHVNWNPSREHRAAIEGTPEQRERWEQEAETIEQDAALLEGNPRYRAVFNPAARLMGVVRGYQQ